MIRPRVRIQAGPLPQAEAVGSNGRGRGPAQEAVFDVRDVSVSYGSNRALAGVYLQIQRNRITALIGPSGCGKTTFIRSLNRMNDSVPGFRIDGQVLYHGHDVYGSRVDRIEVRRRIGMVFQKPTPFPTMSIEDNVAAGLKLNGIALSRSDRDRIVEQSLKRAALWEEVKDRLARPGASLSGGQQQRLCVARALAVEPEVLLMDEPCSALDPISTARIEELLLELKERYTIVIVTHNMQQAARCSDYTAFLYAGDLIEFGETRQIFTTPTRRETEDYITGRFG